MYDRVFQSAWWQRNRTLARIVGIIFVLHMIYLIIILLVVDNTIFSNVFLAIDVFAILLPTAVAIMALTFLAPLRHWWSRQVWYIVLSIHSIALVTMNDLYSIICYYDISLGICDLVRDIDSEQASASVTNSSYYLVLGPFLALVVFRNHPVYQSVAMVVSIATYIWSIILRNNTVASWVSVALTLGAYGVAFAVKRVQERTDFDAYTLENDLQAENAATKEALEKKAQADLQKEQFTSFVFHEIRNPLNTVILGSNILDNNESFKGDITPDQQENFQRIKIGLASIENVINDTLDYRRSASGRLVMDNQPFDLMWTIEQAIAQSIEHGKPIELIKNIDGRIENLRFKVVGDMLRVKNLLVTYLSNAFKYTQSGTVTLTISQEGEMSDNSVRLYVSVRDTGMGMSPENVEKMFKPYIQVRSDSGTGLGLAIAGNILRLMGGTFGLESKLNVGSLFWFRLTLPLSDKPVGDRSAHEDDETSNVDRSLRILVTDDDPITRSLLRKIMIKLGHTCETAENGAECVEMVSTFFDVILLDNQMPVMSGKEALKWIRSHGYTTPIILLTGLSEVNEQNELLDIGANYVLIKPVTMTLIDKTIKRVVL